MTRGIKGRAARVAALVKPAPYLRAFVWETADRASVFEGYGITDPPPASSTDFEWLGVDGPCHSVGGPDEWPLPVWGDEEEGVDVHYDARNPINRPHDSFIRIRVGMDDDGIASRDPVRFHAPEGA